MSDLIDRQATLNAIIKRLCIKDESYLLESERAIYQQILAMPSVTPTDMSVIEDIKAEIQALPKTYPFVNHIDTYVKDADVIKIIERHCGGDTE